MDNSDIGANDREGAGTHIKFAGVWVWVKGEVIG